jgi:hypothetical protein
MNLQGNIESLLPGWMLDCGSSWEPPPQYRRLSYNIRGILRATTVKLGAITAVQEAFLQQLEEFYEPQPPSWEPPPQYKRLSYNN